MKIKIEGKCTPDELVERISKAISHLTKFYPVDGFSGINLYVTLLDQNGEACVIEDGKGYEMASISFPDPKQPKKISPKKQTGKIIEMPTIPLKTKSR